MPFTTVEGTELPVPVLAQIGPKHFEICMPFRYRHKRGEWLVPHSEEFRETDLASVPGFLLWLVPRYGLHTLAALLHDQLVKPGGRPPGGRVEADTIFRDALGELGVPWIRRWMMWAAVSLGTTADSGVLGMVRVVLWAAAVVPAVVVFWQNALAAATAVEPLGPFLIFGHGMLWDLAVVAGAAVVLAPRLGLGWLAGATAVFIGVPTIAVGLASVAYVVLEKAARSGLSAYNWMAQRSFGAQPVENVPVVMTFSAATVAGRRSGCPEFAKSPAPETNDRRWSSK